MESATVDRWMAGATDGKRAPERGGSATQASKKRVRPPAAARRRGGPKDGKLGTFLGVFTPTVLTILGVIMYLRTGWVVAEVGLAVLDPRYRGQGLLTRLLELLVEHAAGRGWEGLFYQAPAHRREEQQGLVEAGFHETALLLGGLPPAKDASGEGPSPRLNAVVFHRRLHEDQTRDIYVPFHHQGMVRRILQEVGLERNLVPPGSQKQELEKVSLLDVEMHGAQGRALITVSRYGRDLEDQVRAQLKDLCLRDMACIHLDLPLDHPAAQETCASLEMAGFFFAGLLPRRGGESDVLRLQYLNHVRLELEDLQPVSPLGEALVDYVASQYLRVE